LQGGNTYFSNQIGGSYYNSTYSNDGPWAWSYFVNAPTGEKAGNLTQDGNHKDGTRTLLSPLRFEGLLGQIPQQQFLDAVMEFGYVPFFKVAADADQIDEIVYNISKTLSINESNQNGYGNENPLAYQLPTSG
jgi:hypothetical protein